MRALRTDSEGGGAATRTTLATLVPKPVQLQSPTTGDARCFVDSPFVALISAPVSVWADPALGPAFEVLVKGRGPRGMMVDANVYALAASVLPSFASAVGSAAGDVTATALFSKASLCTSAWIFPPGCKPELHVCGGGGVEPAFRPAYNGELKTAGDCRALEQAAFYTSMDMVRIFFPASEDGTKPCARRFF